MRNFTMCCRVIKSSTVGWTGLAARMGEMNAFGIIVRKHLGGGDCFVDLGVVGRVVLNKYGLGLWIEFVWLRMGSGGGIL